MRRLAILMLMTAIAATGCGDDAEDAGGTSESSTSAEIETTTTSAGARQALHPTYPAEECCNQAGLVLGPQGSQLVGDPSTGCVWFQGIGSDARVAVVWPEGFTVSFGPLRVYGFDGQIFAEEGVTYTRVGGSEESNPPPECREDPTVVVTTWRIGEVSEPLDP